MTANSAACGPPIVTKPSERPKAPVLVTVNVRTCVAPATLTAPKSVPSVTLGVPSPSAMFTLLPKTAISGVSRPLKGSTDSTSPELPL